MIGLLRKKLQNDTLHMIGQLTALYIIAFLFGFITQKNYHPQEWSTATYIDLSAFNFFGTVVILLINIVVIRARKEQDHDRNPIHISQKTS